VGVRTVYQGLRKYRDQVGAAYFTPAPLLQQLADAGERFYRT